MFKENKIFYLITNYICLFIFINCLFLNTNYASSKGTVFLTSNQKNLEKGEEIEITVNIDNTKTAAFNFSLYFDNSKLEYLSGPENTNVVENRIIFVWYDSKGGNEAKEGELAKFKFKAKEEGLATFTIQGEFYSQVGQLIETDFKEKQVEIGKEKTDTSNNIELANANLEILAIENTLLNPPFDNNETNYKVEISNEANNINLLAVPEDERAVIKINGKDNIKEGNNLISVVVTAPNGFTTKKYQVEVYKRNLEEETKYKEEQELNKKRLEQAYKIEELSTSIDKEKKTEENNNKYKVILVSIIMLGIIGLIIYFWKIKHK